MYKVMRFTRKDTIVDRKQLLLTRIKVPTYVLFLCRNKFMVNTLDRKIIVILMPLFVLITAV